nr:SPFH domain-containing protein [Bathymodiolus platifrons methanotrophic gill symbiont]
MLAFGNYSYRIDDPKAFFVNVVGAGNDFYIEDFRQVMSSRLVHPLTDFLAESRYSYAEIDAKECARNNFLKQPSLNNEISPLN